MLLLVDTRMPSREGGQTTIDIVDETLTRTDIAEGKKIDTEKTRGGVSTMKHDDVKTRQGVEKTKQDAMILACQKIVYRGSTGAQ